MYHSYGGKRMEPIKLLIVEDQELIRSSLHIVLDIEEDLAVVAVAADGQQAVELAREKRPDLVLMDIHMPVMNGIEATRTIKREFPEIKIIVLTTFQEMDFVVEALQAGAEGYLLKAIDTKDLVSGIRVVMQGGTLITQEIAKALFADHIHRSKGAAQDEDKYKLSKREAEILQYLADGLSNELIAEKLFLSMGTIKNYISSLYTKLDVANRTEAVRKAKKEDLI